MKSFMLLRLLKQMWGIPAGNHKPRNSQQVVKTRGEILRDGEVIQTSGACVGRTKISGH